MLRRSGGLMYVAGIDGDFTDDPRTVARLPGVFAPPKEQPFHINSLTFSDPYDKANFASSAQRTAGYRKSALVDRRVGPKSHELQRIFTSGRTVTSVRIRARHSDDWTEMIEYAMHDASITWMAFDAGNMVSTVVTSTESMRFEFRSWEARLYN